MLIPGSNEVAVELTPFHTPDLRGAYVGAQALTFHTGDGYEVRLVAGTFDGPTRLRVEPGTVGFPSPRDLRQVAASADFGGGGGALGLHPGAGRLAGSGGRLLPPQPQGRGHG